jgi:hypothetical protein
LLEQGGPTLVCYFLLGNVFENAQKIHFWGFNSSRQIFLGGSPEDPYPLLEIGSHLQHFIIPPFFSFLEETLSDIACHDARLAN